jgi:hypothetical protein
MPLLVVLFPAAGAPAIEDAASETELAGVWVTAT